MEEITLRDTLLKLKIKYGKRKSLRIVVHNNLEVHVNAPKYISRKKILNLIKEKEDWIFDRINDIEKINPVINKQFVDGETFSYLGKEYILNIYSNEKIRKSTIELTENNIIITVRNIDTVSLGDILTKWYIEEARELIQEIMTEYQDRIGIEPNKVFMKNQKTLWGSCSSKQNLNFNWRLILAPRSIVEYVVVHEMCHLIIKNHSKQFWDLVSSFLSDYKERRLWLKKNGKLLNIFYLK